MRSHTGYVDAAPDDVFAAITDIAGLPDWNDRIQRVLVEPVRLEWAAYLKATRQRSKKLYKRHGFAATGQFAPAARHLSGRCAERPRPDDQDRRHAGRPERTEVVTTTRTEGDR